jgi:hypothetical protein
VNFINHIPIQGYWGNLKRTFLDPIPPSMLDLRGWAEEDSSSFFDSSFASVATSSIDDDALDGFGRDSHGTIFSLFHRPFYSRISLLYFFSVLRCHILH